MASISGGMVTFVDPQTGSTLVLPILLVTRQRVERAIAERRSAAAASEPTKR